MNQSIKTKGGKSFQEYRFPKAPFVLIGLGGLALCVVVWWYSFGIPDIPQKYAFIAQSCLNILILVVVTVQAAIYAGQWRVMRESLRQTAAVINQMADQTQAMNQQAEHMESGLVLAREANATTRLAADAAKASADSLKALERADVLLTIVDFNGVGDIEREILFEFKNAGRSRAKDVAMSAIIHASADTNRIDANIFRTEVLLLPDQHTWVMTPRVKEWLTQEAFDQIVSGVLDLKFEGTVQFSDAFGGKATIDFCGAFDHSRKVFTFEQEKRQENQPKPN